VKWLVEDVLRPDGLEPDPEQMVRGSYAHTVLHRTYARLREETGERRLTPSNLATAERILLEELRAHRSEFRLSPKQTRVRAAVRRLEFDLLRHLRAEAESDTHFEPAELELSFGLEEDGLPVLPIGDGLSVRGKIDRVDSSNGHALVRDYKSGKTVFPVAQWRDKHRLQVAVYMLAVRELLGLEPAGGVYVPLAGTDRRPRGLLRADLAGELGSGWVANDLKPSEEFEAELDHARETVRELAARMRAGDVRPCPDSCAWRGGCSYPSICGEEA
jgi:ATP-dependent helicase/DNAse subunit B